MQLASYLFPYHVATASSSSFNLSLTFLACALDFLLSNEPRLKSSTNWVLTVFKLRLRHIINPLTPKGRI